MVSFSCETCGDILKKPKLPQHAQRCYAVYTCIDCNHTFEGDSWMAHKSCVSEEERYQKSVYKPPKGKGAKGQHQQAAASAPAPAPAPVVEPTPEVKAPAPAVTTPAATEPKKDKKSDKEKKRAREETKEVVETKEDETAAVPTASTSAEPSEPSKKKSKKDKKAKKAVDAAITAESAAIDATSAPTPTGTISSFLAQVVPTLVTESKSFATLRSEVVAKADAAGWKDRAAVEKALEEGVRIGGDKPKKMLKLSFEA